MSRDWIKEQPQNFIEYREAVSYLKKAIKGLEDCRTLEGRRAQKAEIELRTMKAERDELKAFLDWLEEHDPEDPDDWEWREMMLIWKSQTGGGK